MTSSLADSKPSGEQSFAKRVFTTLTLRKILYTIGYLGQGLMLAIIMFFQQAFLLEVAEISAAWVGNMLLLKQFWDGAVDPFIGAISDSLETRWGRRRPICVVVLLPMMTFWVLQWCSPGWVYENEWLKICYYFTMILLASLTMGLFFVPYQAVIPDFAMTYNSRTRLVLGVRMFATFGTGTGSFVWMHLVDFFPLGDDDTTEATAGMPYDYRKGYLWAAVTIAVPVFITSVVGILAMRELPKEKEIESLEDQSLSKTKKRVRSLKKTLKMVFGLLTFPPFLILLSMHILAAIAMALFSGNTVLYFKYVVGREEATSAALLILQATLVTFMVIWMVVRTPILSSSLLFLWANVTDEEQAAIATKLKIIVFAVGNAILVGSFAWMYFHDEDTELWVVMVNMAIIGSGSSAAGLMVNAMIPDVQELHFKKVHERQEALFYGVFNFIETFAQGIAAMAAGYALEWAGYLNPAAQAAAGVTTQPDSAIAVMKWAVSFAPLITAVLCFPMALIYFFTVERKFKEGRRLAKLFGDGDGSNSDEESPLFADFS